MQCHQLSAFSKLSNDLMKFYHLGIGCASFGHSCYGGHGKRSESAVNLQEVDTSDQPPLPVVRFLQRRFSIQQDASANEMIEREKEAKLVILGVISGVIEESMKKLSAVEQETS